MPAGREIHLVRPLPEHGIHFARVTIVGPVGPGRAHEPDDIADHLWNQHSSPGETVTVLLDDQPSAELQSAEKQRSRC